MTLAISDALLVELDDEIYAVPHVSIEGVVRVSKTELLNSYDGRSGSFNYADHDYHVRYLGALLNTGQVNLSEQRKWYPLLLVRAGEHRIALQVDGLLGNRQIVVKPVGPQISSVRWISGGTILGTAGGTDPGYDRTGAHGCCTYRSVATGDVASRSCCSAKCRHGGGRLHYSTKGYGAGAGA